MKCFESQKYLDNTNSLSYDDIFNFAYKYIENNCLKNGQIVSFINKQFSNNPLKLDNTVFTTAFVLKTIKPFFLQLGQNLPKNMENFIEANKKTEMDTWGYFLNEIYHEDWDTTAICRHASSYEFDNSFLVDIFEKNKAVKTWINYTHRYFKYEIDLCVNLNIIDYLFEAKCLKKIPMVILGWINDVLKTKGKKYYSSYYYIYEFFLYQVSKLVYKGCIKEIKLIETLKHEIKKKQIVHHNFLAFLLRIISRKYVDPNSDMTNYSHIILTFLHEEKSIPLDEIYWGYGWYMHKPVIASFSCPSISVAFIIEYFCINLEE